MRWKMKGELTRLVMGTIKLKCPLCKESFRIKYVLFEHIRGEHSHMELERYLKKKRIKLKND